MGSTTIGRLRVILGADSSGLDKGLARVRAQFVAVSAAAAAFGAALSAVALKAAQEIDRAAKSARRLDASVGAFRALETAAGEAGVPLSGVTNDIQNMNRELANIGISGNADRALGRLGLSVGDLAGLDADEKIATIADRIKALGLSAGEVTAVLRDLGVRNREMALLMIGGGDAIRKARADIEAYGLAIDEVDASAIEAANDRIGRLSYVARYAGQQLAIALVPAMGRLAQAMTDSLREGGALRGVIDGITENVVRLSTWVATAATAFGVRYVGALAAARLATLSLGGALVALRGALVRTGIGALVVGAGELVYRFGRLVNAAGGFGEALSLLKDVASEVWQRIGDGADYVRLSVATMINKAKAAFAAGLNKMAVAWVEFTWAIADGLNNLFGTSLMGASAEITQDTAKAAKQATAAAEETAAAANAAAKAFGAPLRSLQALRDTMSGVTEDTTDAAEAADGLSGSLGTADAAGGDGGVASAAKEATEALTEVEQRAKSASDAIRQSFSGAFSDVLKRTKTLGEGVAAVLRKIGDMFLDTLGNVLFSGVSSAIGGAVAGSIPGFANGTDSAPGGLAWVGERGRELVNLPRGSQVIPNHRLGALERGPDRDATRVEIVPSEYFDVRVAGIARGTAGPMISGAADRQRQALPYFMRAMQERGALG